MTRISSATDHNARDRPLILWLAVVCLAILAIVVVGGMTLADFKLICYWEYAHQLGACVFLLALIFVTFRWSGPMKVPESEVH